jgi:hypothetical protein
MYVDLIRNEGIPSKCISWKLKLPLKIKVFLWYLKLGVILTKDNLVKRKWQGCTKCSFGCANESIEHLFLECHMARFIWNSAYITFGIWPPTSVSNLFGSWLSNFSLKLRNQILIGAPALCWAIWLSRNDVVFKRTKPNSFVQVISRGTHWTRCWSLLSKEEERMALK